MLLLLLAGVFPALSAQIIYLNNGSSITGEIVSEESTKDYYIVDIYTGKVPVLKANVVRIVEGQEYLDAKAQADALSQQKKWIKAALLYKKAAESTDDMRIQSDCREQIERICLEISTELKQGNPRQLSLDQCLLVARYTQNPVMVDQIERVTQERLLDKLRNWLAEGKTAASLKKYEEAQKYFDQVILPASGESLLRSDKPVAEEWELIQEARNEKARIYIEQSRGLINSNRPVDRQLTELYLKRALEVQPDNDRANYMLGWLYRKDDYKTLPFLKKVRDSKELTEQERLWVRNYIDRTLARWEQRAKKKAEAKLKAEQTPPPPRARTAIARVEQWWGDFQQNSSGSYWQQGKVALSIIIPALLVLLFLYYIPYRITKSHFGKLQDPPKRDYVRLARFTGIIGMIIYFLSRLLSLGGGRSKMPCPHCKKPLDSPAVFTDWNFNRCPYCGKTIKAPYKMQDYIRALGESIASNREAAQGKKGRGGGSVVSADSTLKLLRAIITYSFRMRASDIHVEAEDPGDLLFRFRIDGVMHDGARLPHSLHPLVVTSIKNMAKLDIAERRVPQDGHFSLLVDKTDLNIRVSTTPTRTGEKAVLRLLVPQQTVLQLRDLGFTTESLMKYERAVLNPHGIILTTGPTGSGKTTTLYSSLSLLADGQRNIVTIEDPIEYTVNGVNQTQVNTKAGLTFSNALRSILRQDPDVIMVGEVRDHETAEIACSAAMTGHLVFSTLHTIDASTALSRLIDLGIEPKQVASAVIAIMAQRLVRKVCPHCGKGYRPRQDELESLGIREDDFTEELRFKRGQGCDECQNTGYWGRTGLFEVLLVDSPKGNVKRTLESGASVAAIRDAARRDGMRTLREEGIVKVMQGETTVAEILRVTRDENRVELNPFSDTNYS